MESNSSNSSAYQVLSDPELLFKMVFNQKFQFMAILSPDGKVLEINEFALTSQGVKREDYIGKLLWQSPAWCNLPEWENIWKKRLVEASNQQDPVITKDIFQVEDGSVHYADASTTAIYDPKNGEISGYIIQAKDTTKDRQIENQIQENEARLKFVMQQSQIGNWELNLIDHTSHRSLKHDQIFGYDSLLPQWTYEMFLQHVIPEDRTEVDRKFQKAINNKTDWNFECRILRKDGEIRWILASGGHSLDKAGQAMLMAGIVQDVTELKQVELNKSRHNAELQSLFKALPDTYFRMMPDGTILDYHAQNKDELYMKPEDFLGKRMQDVLPQHIGELFLSKIDEMAQSQKTLVFNYELIVNNEVTHFDARLNKIPLNDQLICVIRDVTDEFKSKKSLAVSEQLFRTIFEQAAIGVALVSANNGEFIRINQRYCEMLGYSVEEMENGIAFKDITHPDDLQMGFNTRDKILSGQQREVTLEKRYIHKDGHIVWVELTVSSTWKVGEQPDTFIVVVQDITNRKLEEEKLRLLSRVFSETHEGIIITDPQLLIINVNPAFSRITGYSCEEVKGKNPRILSSGKQEPEFYVDMWQKINEHGHWQGEVWNRKKNGEIYAELLTISVLKDTNDNVVNYVGVFTDITNSKRQQEQLSLIAHYDILTNLPNRSLLADRLSRAMLQCSRHEQSLAVVFLDLDGFKHVNDTYGHGMGDELLIALSVRMKQALRVGDSLARIGGDEFVAVLADLTTVEDCEPVLDRLLLAASEPVTVGDVVLNVSASIGLTLYPQDNVDADLLMRHADQAMYAAKESGKNRYHLFNTAQDDAIKVQRESLEAIRNALDNHQFVLHYQPKVNMKSGKVTGFEALIRWQHPERGLLNPIEFLPIIENNPMSIELGEWVIDTALTQISQWQAMGINHPLSTSVNIAAVQLQQPDFTQKLITLLAAHPDVEPQYLEMEVLETSALDDVQHVSTIMNACMALGVKFALDDFGTGYSSLTYLRRLPASLIKIDQTFVRDMLDDTDDLAIIEGVIALAKSFKREVIAEGVETIEHGTALLQLGCELAQGYGIAKPMPASDIPAWVSDWKPNASWQI
jgi:diguanylate cyclase (GGDEF)-like protein/PAS domain S-box-containing protein